MPMPTITATTIRMTLRALLPPVVGGTEAGVTPGVGAAAATATPHLLQNVVPALRVAPQELQNAISHLVQARREESTAREYRRCRAETEAPCFLDFQAA